LEHDRDRLTHDTIVTEMALSKLRAEHEQTSKEIIDGWNLRTPALNYDIMHSILDQFRPASNFWEFDENTHGYGVLHNLCLVSKQWLHPSRKILYHTFASMDNAIRTRRFVRCVGNSPNVGILVRRVHVDPLIVDSLALFPNVGDVWITTIRSEDLDRLLLCPRIKGLLYMPPSKDMWTEQMWKRVSISWPHLETLAILDESRVFGPGASQADQPFVSLRNLTLDIRDHATMEFIPTIVRNTLRVVDLSVEEVDGDVVEYLFYEHLLSLERFTLVSQKKVVLSRPLALSQASRLEHIEVQSGETTTSLTSEEMPPLITDMTVIWPTWTPEKALRFLHKKPGGPLRSVYVHVANGTAQDWENVRVVAGGLGIDIRCQALGRPPLWTVPHNAAR
jgi:hypothetical protein